jgi:hypothetical protein
MSWLPPDGGLYGDLRIYVAGNVCKAPVKAIIKKLQKSYQKDTLWLPQLSAWREGHEGPARKFLSSNVTSRRHICGKPGPAALPGGEK